MLKRFTSRTFSETFEEIEARTEIDKPIRHIVKYLNNRNGVETFCSCGGHRNPTEYQHAEDDFSISFVANPKDAVKLVKEIFRRFEKDDNISGQLKTLVEINYCSEVADEPHYVLSGYISNFEWMKEW